MTDSNSGTSDRLHILNAMHGGRKVVSKRIFFLASKRTNQNQNPASHPCFA
jgi:hypothetical protein